MSIFSIFFLICIELLDIIADRRFHLKLSISGFSPSELQTSIPSNDGRSIVRLSANFEYGFQSLLWCMNIGPIKAGGFAVSLCISFRFLEVETVKEIFSLNIFNVGSTANTQNSTGLAKRAQPLITADHMEGLLKNWLYATITVKEA